MTNNSLYNNDIDIEFDNPMIGDSASALAQNTSSNNSNNDFDEEDFFNTIEPEPLNPAYDAVSKNGALPNLSSMGFGDTGREIDDPFLQEQPPQDFNNFNSFDNEIGNEIPTDNNQETDAEQDIEPEENISLRNMLNGQYPSAHILTQKIIKPALAIACLCVLIITYRNIVETQLNQIATLTENIEKLKAESIVIANELANFCKESQVSQRVESQTLGIHTQKEPPKYIIIKSYQQADTLKNEEELFLKHRKQLPKKQNTTQNTTKNTTQNTTKTTTKKQ